MRLILASASPRRADLLEAAGIHVDIQPADVDESIQPGEAVEQYVCRLALAKARAVSDQATDRFVLGADTAVVIDGEILGKPRDRDDARRMLCLLSGRSHLVITGVALVGPVRDRPQARPGPGLGTDPDRSSTCPRSDVRSETTAVEFARMSDQEIDWYVSSGEPMDKAGAYAIQGLASRFVTRVQGSYSNVVGLPIALVYEMCKGVGLLLS